MQGNDFDVLIVGAGLSGIAAAYYLQSQCPNKSYAILEARAQLGGTWDLFRYPGIRSDSDMYTLGYSFRTWKERKTIADGPSILRYIQDTAKEFGIDRHILFQHKVIAADWSSESARWSVEIEKADTGSKFKLNCRFLFMCSGYYDYDEGYTPDYPGISRFEGKIIHPQKWDESLDYQEKNIVVIGSGATAVTLVPELAKKAKRVIMLQRSPTYMVSWPSVDRSVEFMSKVLPNQMAHSMARWKNILFGIGTYQFCRQFPKLARSILLEHVQKKLGHGSQQIQDFIPKYNPWDQRLCLVPDSDLFHALRSGKAEIATGTIEAFTKSGIQLQSGQHLVADWVVSATGLKLKFLAGLNVCLDGKPIRLADSVPYQGAMLSGIPNLGMAFGYTNASWTLKCDLICEWISKLLKYMDLKGHDVVVPEKYPEVELHPLVDFTSGYFQRAKDILPFQGNRSPWKLNQNYFSDLLAFKFRPFTDPSLRFSCLRTSEQEVRSKPSERRIRGKRRSRTSSSLFQVF